MVQVEEILAIRGNQEFLPFTGLAQSYEGEVRLSFGTFLVKLFLAKSLKIALLFSNNNGKPISRESTRKIRNEEPREVKFKGLAFMDNSRPRFIELGFDRLYQMTQYGERSREQVLEELIPELWPSVLNNWVGVVEMQEDPKRPHHSISTTFDHNSSRGTYFVRKTF